ncbi:cytochrome P450 [Exophiala viscosa]|uniref:cytochrome P450 n=1 Tax=Exophiala viscosa TaxID=2486360 RepID=UPI002193FF18|nr:cytochrome P450 [Exophiala viscosa]
MALTFMQAGTALIVLVAFRFIWVGSKQTKKSLPLPPGPKGLPLIGNLQDLPPPGVQEWVHWTHHKDLYGPISSVTVMGQTIVILNDPEAAIELLEKRSAIYSARPRLVFAFEMCGWLNFLSSLPPGQRFRSYRKYLHSLLGASQLLDRFGQLQEQEVAHCLLRILQTPQDLIKHIRTEAGAIILKIAYGYTIEPHRPDPLVSLADEALDQFSQAAVPGKWLVDIVPALRHLPEWFPGAGFKRTAKQWNHTLEQVVEAPHKFVEHQISKGAAPDSFLGDYLKNEKLASEQELDVKFTTASLYTGGADTTVATLSSFSLAMMLHPEVQKKAQEEIDRVVGTDRLPTFSDRPNLPYIDAMVKESLRWHPIGPMGLPHASTQADEYNGYLIPEGAILLQNIWLFTHDPETYRDPMRFKPARFIQTDDHAAELDPTRYVFGFGRRICPGRVLADQSIYLTIAQMLAVFDISKPDGVEVAPEFLDGIISHPKPFQANIRARDAQREKLIRDLEMKFPWEQSDAHDIEGLIRKL